MPDYNTVPLTIRVARAVVKTFSRG